MPCSGSTDALQSTCLAHAVAPVFHPLAVHFIAVEVFWFPDVAVEEVFATKASTGVVVVV